MFDNDLTVDQAAAAHLCPTHGEVMVERDLKGATNEQEFCGKWFDCPRPGCTNTTLEQSAELQAQLAQQEAARNAAVLVPKFHILVKPEGKKTSSYLSSNGSTIRLKVHAAMYTRERAEQIVSEIQADHGTKYSLRIVPVR